jgi:hypothetical protein
LIGRLNLIKNIIIEIVAIAFSMAFGTLMGGIDMKTLFKKSKSSPTPSILSDDNPKILNNKSQNNSKTDDNSNFKSQTYKSRPNSRVTLSPKLNEQVQNKLKKIKSQKLQVGQHDFIPYEDYTENETQQDKTIKGFQYEAAVRIIEDVDNDQAIAYIKTM